MLKELPCYAHDTGTIITYYESSEKKRKIGGNASDNKSQGTV